MPRYSQPKTKPLLKLIREKFEDSLPHNWWVDANECNVWIEGVLGPSVNTYLAQNNDEWEPFGHRIFGLTESIAHLSVALSRGPRKKGEDSYQVKRHALFLAAVLVSNACYELDLKGRKGVKGRKGKPCSGVTVAAFKQDAGQILALFAARYKDSGLPFANQPGGELAT